MDINSMPHPMEKICELWLKKIKIAETQKQDLFGRYAKESTMFFDSVHDAMWKTDSDTGNFIGSKDSMPHFKMQVNRVFEAVALFGPALVHKNPKVLVTTTEHPEITPAMIGLDQSNEQDIQMYQQFLMQEDQGHETRKGVASLKESVSNWLQIENDKKTVSRKTVEDAIVAGAGYQFIGMHTPPGSEVAHPKATYLSWEDIVKDPDASYYEDIQWIAVKKVEPVNILEERFDIPQGVIAGHMQSLEYANSKSGSNNKSSNKKEQTHDLIEYWDIYSKNGFGHMANDFKSDSAMTDEEKSIYDQFGKYNRIVVAKDVPFPLNIPSWLLEEEEEENLMSRVSWPIPFWRDGGWPVVELGFYGKSKLIWPISLIKPGIGELRFINWCMSYLADRVAASCDTIVGVLKDQEDDIKEQVTARKDGAFKVVSIPRSAGIDRISDAISFVQPPEVNSDIWNVISAVIEQFDKRVGLTDLVYGLSNTQMRSATEADIKGQNVSIRPDDMAEKVEDFLSLVAKREIEAAVWMMKGEDLKHVLGEMGSMVWDTQVYNSEVNDVVRDYNYRIEAGSARKPNRAQKVRSLNELGQIIMPVLQQMVAEGQPEAWNAFMKNVGDAMDVDTDDYTVPPPPPPEEQGPSEEEMALQMKQAEFQQEMEIKYQAHMMDMTSRDDTHDQDMKESDEEHELQMVHDEESHNQKIQELKQEAHVKKQRHRDGD